MKTELLRCGRRLGLARAEWTVPGFSNAVTYIPGFRPFAKGWGAAVRWPAHDPHDGSEILRTVDLNRHRQIARHAIRTLLTEAAR